jgi:hypothetical protein
MIKRHNLRKSPIRGEHLVGRQPQPRVLSQPLLTAASRRGGMAWSARGSAWKQNVKTHKQTVGVNASHNDQPGGAAHMASIRCLSNNNNIQDILMTIVSTSYMWALYNGLPTLAFIPPQRLLQCRPARRQKAGVHGKDLRNLPRDLVQV